MIQCSACGLQNPDDGKFCTDCGKPLAQAPPAPAGTTAFCTNCGARMPADSRFCTACGVPVGSGTAAVTPAPGQAPANGEYLPVLDARLAGNGFEKLEVPALLILDRWMRRKRFELAKTGMITTFCGIKLMNAPANAAAIRSFSESVFGFALSKKGFLARNAFQQLLVYPVLVAPSLESDVEAFLDSYWNTHYMAYEYPVAVSLATQQLAMHRPTPIWGAAFHGSFRREAESLFAF